MPVGSVRVSNDKTVLVGKYIQIKEFVDFFPGAAATVEGYNKGGCPGISVGCGYIEVIESVKAINFYCFAESNRSIRTRSRTSS